MRPDPRLDRARLSPLDYPLPNDEQVLALSGEDELVPGCRALIERGVGCAAAALVAQGLGSDHGDLDLAAADAFAAANA